jgi:hypothetical protein
VTIIPKKTKKRAKFANITKYENWKKKKKRGSFHILGYLIELIIKVWCFRIIFSPKSGQFETISFSWEILQIGWNLKSYFSGANLAKKMTIKKITELHIGNNMQLTTHTE